MYRSIFLNSSRSTLSLLRDAFVNWSCLAPLAKSNARLSKGFVRICDQGQRHLL